MLQVLLNGLQLAGVYGLVALGVSLVFGVLHVPDFSMGAKAMAGAYGAWYLQSTLQAPYLVALLGAVLLAGALGAVSEVLIFRPLRNRPAIFGFIGSFGFLLILQVGALIIWGPDYRKVEAIAIPSVTIWGSIVSGQRLLIVAIALLVVIAFHLYLKYAGFGLAMRAAAQDSYALSLMGLDRNRIALFAGVLGSGLAGLAGGLLAPITSVYPTFGDSTIIFAFAAVVLGGMGSVEGALIAALVIGLAQAFTSYYISPDHATLVVFVIVFAVFVLRPRGLFGKVEVARA